MFSEELEIEINKVLQKLQISGVKTTFEHPADFNFGDYSTNIGLIAAKLQGEPSQLLAKEIAKTWQELGLPDFVEKIEVAAPGFINIWLKIDSLSKLLTEVIKEEKKFGGSEEGKGKIVVIDYSAPNIAKPFGIGHLRSTNIGQALYNLFSFAGWKTIGDNHLGDWGTQFGSLIVQIKKAEREGLRLKELTVADLEKLYVQFHKEVIDHPELEEDSLLATYYFQPGCRPI